MMKTEGIKVAIPSWRLMASSDGCRAKMNSPKMYSCSCGTADDSTWTSQTIFFFETTNSIFVKWYQRNRFLGSFDVFAIS